VLTEPLRGDLKHRSTQKTQHKANSTEVSYVPKA
jgi:hypothetical protein